MVFTSSARSAATRQAYRRLARSGQASLPNVGGETMLKDLAVAPFSRRKGSTLYDRVDLDRAIDKRKYAEAAEQLKKQ